MALTELKMKIQTKASVDSISGTKITIVGVGQVYHHNIVRIFIAFYYFFYNFLRNSKVGISIAFSIMTQVRIFPFVSSFINKW
jgi:hypothetical protein